MFREENKRAGTSRIFALLLGVAACAAFVVVTGCGSIQDVAPQRGSLSIAQLPAASPALLEQALPGCENVLADAASVALMRHPTASDLVVALVDDEAVCVDTPEAMLATDLVALLPVQIKTQVMVGDATQEQAAVPIANGATATDGVGGDQTKGDDPVPIRGDVSRSYGDGSRQDDGDQPEGDDPVPIHGSSAAGSSLGGEEVGDDPVPIQPPAVPPPPEI